MTEKEINDETEGTDEPEVIEIPVAKRTSTPPSRWLSNTAYHNDPAMIMSSRPATIDDREQDNLWSIPWSSLMMVLFAVLFMLISLQPGQETTSSDLESEPVVQPEPAAAEIQDATNIVAKNITMNPAMTDTRQTLTGKPVPNLIILTKLRDAIPAENSPQILTSLTDDGSVKINLAAGLLFEQGQSSLTETARQVLRQVAPSLSETPYQINVIGHTDDSVVDITQYQDNWALSLARAGEVARFLIQTGQIEAHKFTIMGRAQFDPVASNLTATSRAMNRRVEIIVTQKRYHPLENRL